MGHLDHSILTSLKNKNKDKEAGFTKNRRTGSTDCTNNNKLQKRDVKQIPNFHKKAVLELDHEEGEIIVSNRRNDPDRVSPSPSPAKYDIEPNKTKRFDMAMLMKGSNYESTKHTKK